MYQYFEIKNSLFDYLIILQKRYHQQSIIK
jgi:hypothetical protein